MKISGRTILEFLGKNLAFVFLSAQLHLLGFSFLTKEFYIILIPFSILLAIREYIIKKEA